MTFVFRVSTNPPRAIAIFDDDPGFQCVSFCEMRLERGRHTIALNQDGFRDERRIFNIPQDTNLSVDLSRLAGVLSLSSIPPGLSVVVDGREQPGTTPLRLMLSPGHHHVEVIKGNERQPIDVKIRDRD